MYGKFVAVDEIGPLTFGIETSNGVTSPASAASGVATKTSAAHRRNARLCEDARLLLSIPSSWLSCLEDPPAEKGARPLPGPAARRRVASAARTVAPRARTGRSRERPFHPAKSGRKGNECNQFKRAGRTGPSGGGSAAAAIHRASAIVGQPGSKTSRSRLPALRFRGDQGV